MLITPLPCLSLLLRSESGIDGGSALSAALDDPGDEHVLSLGLCAQGLFQYLDDVAERQQFELGRRATCSRMNKEIADAFSPDRLHAALDRHAAMYCPLFDVLTQSYHGSLMQREYSTDLTFRSPT